MNIMRELVRRSDSGADRRACRLQRYASCVRRGSSKRNVCGGGTALVMLTIVAALLFAAPVASARAAQAGSGYLLEQRAAGTVLRVILAPSGLRMDVSAPSRTVRSGKRVKIRPMVGMIVTYRDGRLVALDPARRSYQALPVMSAVSSYEAELKLVAKAQPSAELPPRPGTKSTGGQAPLTPPTAHLERLRLSTRIGPLQARAYLLVQGSLRERVWYAAALPSPPARMRSLLAQALGGAASDPLGRALRLHAAQIPLRIDVRNRRRWSTVLRTVALRRTRVASATLRPPRGYRKTILLGSGAPERRPHETPASPVRCGLLLITSVLGCTSIGADLTGLAGPISEHPAIWADYWGSGWADHLDYVSAINHGLENMVGDQFADPNSQDFWGPLGQYGVHRGRFLGYQVVNDNPDRSVGSWNFFDVGWFVLSHRWGTDAPHYWWRWSDQDPIFAIFVDGSRLDQSSWGGYHAFVPTEGLLFAFLAHVAMPYFIVKVPSLDSLTHARDTPPFQQAVDTATERASHELVEAATDPYPFTSWADPLKEPIWEQGEISDICSVGNHFPWATATRVLQFSTALSTYWSNQDNACVPASRPSVQLLLPNDGDTTSWGASVTMIARTTDPYENGPVADSEIQWRSDGVPIPGGTGHIFTTSGLSPGTHRITVDVTDARGGFTEAGPVTVHVVTQPPTVRIDSPSSGSSFSQSQMINFRGEAFDPHDGDVGAAATWSADGTPVGHGATLFQYAFSTQGTHTMTLSYTNQGGLTASALVTLNVGPPGQPAVTITQPANNSNFAAGEQITFQADAQPPSGTTITSYTWNDDVDGSLGSGQTITRTLSGSNSVIITHHVTVTAHDSNGQSATDTITVNIGSVS
jgi:Bacterial Ig domain